MPTRCSRPPFSALFFGAPSGGVAADIAVYVAIKEEVGDRMTLMFDGAWRYTYPEELEVGLALQELGYHWYEEPLKSELAPTGRCGGRQQDLWPRWRHLVWPP